jgi:single-strand DNA-binding protein
MTSYSSVTILGRCAFNTKLNRTNNDIPVCNGAVLYSKRVKKGDGYVDKTCYLPFRAFRGLAQLISTHGEKGKQVLLEGFLDQDKFENDRGDTKDVYTLEVETVRFITS